MASSKARHILASHHARLTSARQPGEAALEWRILTTAHPNVLVVGTAAAIEDSVAALMPFLARPVCDWTGETRRRSSREVKTLLIREPGALAPDEQRAVCAWLDEQALSAKTQVVSTTTVPLFPLVEAGLFIEALYYKLNTLMWPARPSGNARARADAPYHARLSKEVPGPLTSMLTRIRAHYLEMPGLRLTLQQVQRLCGVEAALCQTVIDALVDEQFLCCRPNGTYMRPTTGDIPRPRPAKADLGTRGPRR
jgi:hypothetical protein